MDGRSFRKLLVWQKAMELVEVVYRLTAKLPAAERFGLTSQLQRAAVSIPANIAEGYGRSHRAEYIHHLSIARGSWMELETLLILCAKLKLVNRSDAVVAWQQAETVGKMLTKLILSLR